MKKFLTFFGIFVVISIIPAIVYMAYPRHDQETIGASFPSEAPVAGTSSTVEQEVGEYHFEMVPESPPIKTGKQHLKLIASKGAQPLETAPEVAVTMPMGSHTMTAPVEFQKLPTPGQYEIETDFSMGGEWNLEIKPQPNDTPIILTFQVAE